MGKRALKALPRDLQLNIFRRDRWLCHLCGRPVVFPPAMKYLEKYVRQCGYTDPLAYYSLYYRRDTAPLLDHLAAIIDHVKPVSKGGAHSKENFKTACNKCNMQKNNSEKVFPPPRKVRSKHGEPEHWDGFSGLFVVLARQFADQLTAAERDWLRVLLADGSATAQ